MGEKPTHLVSVVVSRELSFFFLAVMNKHMPSGPSGILICRQKFLSSLHLDWSGSGTPEEWLHPSLWQVSGSAPSDSSFFVGEGHSHPDED